MNTKNLYLHVPFCFEIRSYCDFKREVYNKDEVDTFLILLDKELKERKNNWDLETIYIGGGTPSALTLGQTKEMLLTIKDYTDEFDIKEFTIEANPDDVTKEKAEMWMKYGVNRISLDAQTFDDKLLKIIERRHDSTQIYDAFNIIKTAGIDNISIDLIYNLPTQTTEHIKKDLENVNKLNLKHISWYSLVLKEDSKLRNHVIDINLEAEFMSLVQDGLEKQGFQQYEISNFCKDGLESLHNMGYWMSNDWIGIGYGATSFIGGNTIENVGSINKFKQKITENTQIEIHEQVIMMALGYKTGLDLSRGAHLKAFNHFQDQFNTLIKEGSIIRKNNNVFLKQENWMLLDNILLKIF